MEKLFKYINTLIDYIILSIWIYAVIIVPSFLLNYILFMFVPGRYLSEKTIDIANLKFLIYLFLVLPGIGAIMSILDRYMDFIAIWKLKKDEMLGYISLALVVALFSWNILSILSQWRIFGLFILFIFYSLYMPQVIQFLGLIKIQTLTQLISSAKKASVFTVMLISTHLVVNFANRGYNAYRLYQIRLSRYPEIKKIEPPIVYRSNKVVIKGRGFYWKPPNNTAYLKQGDENVITDLWTDTKIVFTVPLNWQDGEIKLWIEKPIGWGGKQITAKSNVVTIKLIPVTGGFTTDDEAYFEQLKSLDKETLKLNGYQ